MATDTWTVGISGDWSDPSKWSTTQVPASGDTAVIASIGTYTVSVTSLDTALAVELNAADATIDVQSGGVLSAGAMAITAGTLQLDSGGTVTGATITPGGGAVLFKGGELDGVTYAGTLDLSAANAQVQIANGLTVENADSTMPGTIALTGTDATLNFINTQTIDNAVIDGGAATSWAALEITPATGSTTAVLTLGSNVTINQTGSFFEIGSLTAFHVGSPVGPPPPIPPGIPEFLVPDTGGDGVVNDGTIEAALAGGYLVVATQSFTNQGQITVSGGDTMVLWPGQFTNAASGTITVGNGGSVYAYPPGFYIPPQSTLTPFQHVSLVGTAGTWFNLGVVSINAGGEFALANVTSSAMLNGITNNGGTLEVSGIINNQNATIALASGTFGGIL